MTPVEIKFIKLSDIDADADWNSRSLNSILSQISETDEESTGLNGLIANILVHGQDTPIDIRPTSPPFYKITKKPYSLIAGFRRFSAITQIVNDTTLQVNGKIPGIPDGLIRAAVHPHMSEHDAFLLNGRENANREAITTVDLYRLIYRAVKEHKMTSPAIAVWLGKSTPRILDYIKMQELPSRVIKHWIEGGDFEGLQSAKRIAINDMLEIAKRKPEEQEDAYKRSLIRQARKADTSAWWERAKGRANAMGVRLARLQKAGFLIVSAPVWTNNIDILVGTGKRELKWKEAVDLSSIAENAYHKELEKVSVINPIEEDFDDEVAIQ